MLHRFGIASVVSSNAKLKKKELTEQTNQHIAPIVGK
jgi:hypothetical protein